MDDLSNRQGTLFKCTSEGNAPNHIYSINPTNPPLPLPFSSSYCLVVTSASVTVSLLADLDLLHHTIYQVMELSIVMVLT